MRSPALALVIALAAAPIALAASHALAQFDGQGPNFSADAVHLKTDVEVKQEQEREAGYKAGLGKIPDAKAKKDPWGNIRGGSTAAQNQSKPGTK